MSLWSYIPGRGPKSTKKKVRELEEEAGSLPIMFGVFVTKIFEQLVAGQFRLALNFAGAATFVALVYIYSKEVKKITETVTETFDETVSED